MDGNNQEECVPRTNPLGSIFASTLLRGTPYNWLLSVDSRYNLPKGVTHFLGGMVEDEER